MTTRYDARTSIQLFSPSLLRKLRLQHIRDTQPLWSAADNHHTRPRLKFPLLHNREVESTATTGQETLDHVIAIEAQRQLVTGHPRPRHHQQSRADSQT